VQQTDVAAPLGAQGTARAKNAFRLLPALEKDARMVRFAQTWAGKATLVVAFGALASLLNKPAAAVGVALVIFFAQRRRLMVALASLGMVIVTHRLDEVLKAVGQQEGLGWLAHHVAFKPAMLLVALVLTVGYVQLAKTWLSGRLLRRPLVTVLGLNAGLLALISLLPLQGVWRLIAWAVVAGAGSYFWYAAYSLKDHVDRHGGKLLKDASAWRPFWGGTNVPFPKAGAELEKLEVRTQEEAAIWQLKALKLVTWALMLALLRTALVLLTTGGPSYPSAWLPDVVLPLPAHLSFSGFGFHVTSLPDAFVLAQAGTPHSSAQNWASLALHLGVDLLDISIFGHVAVAGARMAGFKALRNTHRPLESRSIADFWNRYYFYFKELLVDFFFLPAYLRWFKKHPRLRLFFATFVAAGLGNFIFHWLAEPAGIVTLGLWGSLRARETYALYALVLVIGIALSQSSKSRDALRDPRRGTPPRSSQLARVSTTAGVLLFYCLLQVLNVAPLGSSVGDCFRFFLCLVPQL
jgi:hypothetical protein